MPRPPRVDRHHPEGSLMERTPGRELNDLLALAAQLEVRRLVRNPVPNTSDLPEEGDSHAA